MRRWIFTLVIVTLACKPTNPTDGGEGETSKATSTSTSTGTETGMGSETDTGSETETGNDTGEVTCDPLELTLAPCDPPTLQGFTWDGEACVYVEGCECMGSDCDALFSFEPDFIGSDAPRHAAEHACWSTYIDAGCMTDPCDCPPGEFCVAYYDGTCKGGALTCTSVPEGCEDDPQDCASGCPDQICGSGSECSAPPCGGEWSNAIYCYGI